ncbi:uncharacterized protein BDW47DRAFT_104017 [Aspergillus candidus]|uniref:Uncharacterized protein n=1 Tax=Aspergillus candidus TaxID=41067 RepID=A0A2I2FEB2_ASPCN|nr:hypothetical protein BDW47DRAFT_104017 [Aspergillus candidus]PLB38966.1 hypothetical protein BDW47DRAFT_104017 [Aspergillus candidus]
MYFIHGAVQCSTACMQPTCRYVGRNRWGQQFLFFLSFIDLLVDILVSPGSFCLSIRLSVGMMSVDVGGQPRAVRKNDPSYLSSFPSLLHWVVATSYWLRQQTVKDRG